jgi:hypothetical protein
MLKALPNIPRLSYPYKMPDGWRIDHFYSNGVVKTHFERTQSDAHKYYYKAKERYND